MTLNMPTMPIQGEMKMKNYRASALYIFAAVLLTGIAVAQNPNFVRPVPQCGRPVLEDGDTLFIDNVCNISITVFLHQLR